MVVPRRTIPGRPAMAFGDRLREGHLDDSRRADESSPRTQGTPSGSGSRRGDRGPPLLGWQPPGGSHRSRVGRSPRGFSPSDPRPSILRGMRSSFREGYGETGVAHEVAEACLDHRVGSTAEQAYARSDPLERRRELMEAWGRCQSRRSRPAIMNRWPRSRPRIGNTRFGPT